VGSPVLGRSWGRMATHAGATSTWGPSHSRLCSPTGTPPHRDAPVWPNLPCPTQAPPRAGHLGATLPGGSTGTPAVENGAGGRPRSAEQRRPELVAEVARTGGGGHSLMSSTDENWRRPVGRPSALSPHPIPMLRERYTQSQGWWRALKQPRVRREGRASREAPSAACFFFFFFLT